MDNQHVNSYISLAIPRKAQGKTIGVQLNGTGIMNLNLRLKSDWFKTFSESVHAYIDDKYPAHQQDELIESLPKQLREKGKWPHYRRI